MMKETIAQAENDLLHTYNRYQIVFDHGEGMYLYDTEGKKYLDFFAGIAVFALGHHYKGYDEALKAQIDKLIHTSNYFYNEPAAKAANLLKKASGMDRVFFTNSGAEAIEGALKSARKYAYTKGTGRTDFIAMDHSFHGRTLGALSVTGTEKYRTPFEPLIGKVSFAEMNDLESVKALATEKTCAVILETLQGEGGIYPADPEFIIGLRNFCTENGILLILDEIQCGIGRTGEMFAYQHYGVQPDITTCAKAMGCGVPVGAFMMTEEVAQASLCAGDHGTTYGGNPLACAATAKVLEIFEEDKIVDHVKEMTPYLEAALDDLVQKYDFIKARRGMGFMQGLEFTVPVAPVIAGCMDKGMILINAGANILRFLPPLVTEKEHVDEMHAILDSVLQELK